MRTFTLIPWNQDFMTALSDILVQRDDLSQCTVLFPHNRPKRYLKIHLKEDINLPRPVFLPRMISIVEFITEIRREMITPPVKPVHQLDLVELLREIISDLRQSGTGLLARLPELSREDFLPWGIRLVKLMEDLLRQNMEPEDLKYMEGEVSQYASGLLEQISTIHHEYITRLFARNWTTPGLDWRFITKNIAKISDHLADSPIIAAGFYALSGAEDILFRRLWDDNVLHPIIHSDPALAVGGRKHWATTEHTAWLNRWRTKAEIPPGFIPSTHEPNVRFCEGFDRHSQLAALSDDMEATRSLDDSAVILPDEGAMLPVLHHLPDKEPNISMGYPLDRTSLARLIEAILTLQENKLEDGRYYWRDVVNLIRHPYLRLLGADDKPLRKIFHVWEADIRLGERYISPLEWKPPYADKILVELNEKEADPLRLMILNCCITTFETINSLESLGSALVKLASMLHKYGEKLWHTYLVDAECLFRLTTSVIPQLNSVESAQEEFSKTTLFSLLRQILSQERVSFEAEPLGGLQVLGVLETRLLHFKQLFILDAVEERLPGTNPYDPLLPDPLRKLLGLPDTRERDNVSGYNFYRLLMGAKETVIYYQSGTKPGVLDSKSVRSRFVEQLLWEQEKKSQELLTDGSDMIHTVTFPAGSLQQNTSSITMTSQLREALHKTLKEKGLSPSGLDRYLQCPKLFFYQTIGRIRPVQQVVEDGDRSEFGTLIHDVLSEYMRPFIGRKTDFASLDPTPLLSMFEQRFKENANFTHLPYDTRVALTQTGRFRLKAFHETQIPATLLGLEKKLVTTHASHSLSIPLTGYLDRVEERDEGIVILDYKTGGGVLPQKGFWEDMEIWQRIYDVTDGVPDKTFLTDLAKSVQSIQLPMYMYLFQQCEKKTPHDAGLIKLAENGKTELLFGKKWTDAERLDVVEAMTPKLLKALIHHMLTTDEMSAQPGRRCQWCDYRIPCGQ